LLIVVRRKREIEERKGRREERATMGRRKEEQGVWGMEGGEQWSVQVFQQGRSSSVT